MEGSTHNTPIDELLREAGSIRPLARALLGDGDAALEAAHEAWLQGRDDHGPYLRTSLRNRLRGWRRANQRRERREAEVAQHVATPVDVAAQAEVRTQILAAVTGLPEPHRTAVWLRFFEDLPPRVIAQRLGVPTNTVRSRVRLGLERLRGELDGLHDGDRSQWQRALLPAAGLPAWGAASVGLVLPVFGVLTMKKLTWTSAALVALALGTNVALSHPEAHEPTRATTVAEEPEARGAAPENVRPERKEVPTRPESYVLEGTIDLRDKRSGAALAAGDGVMRIFDNLAERELVVPVRNGAFSLTLARRTELAVSQLHLDVWGIEFAEPTWQCHAEMKPVVFPVLAFPPGELAVVDRRRGAHLRRVDVVRVDSFEENSSATARHGFVDAFAIPVVVAKDSPLAMPGTQREATYRVSAPGYAWAPLEFDHRSGGQRLVLLDPGGDLAVTVHGRQTGAGLPKALLRVRDGSDRCVRECEARAEVRLGRLGCGRYTVSIELGERDAPEQQRFVLARTSVEIVAAGIAKAHLRCAAAPTQERAAVDLRGTLMLPEGWGKPYVQVIAVPLDRPAFANEVASSATRRTQWITGKKKQFHLKGLRPGRYRVIALGVGLEKDIVVRESTPPMHWEAPQPVETEIRLSLPDGSVYYSSSVQIRRTGPDGVDRFVVRGGFVRDGVWRVRTLPGQHRIQISAAIPMEKTVMLQRGGPALEITMEETWGTLLEFRDGTARIPVPPHLVKLVGSHPGATRHSVLDVGFQLSTRVTQPGRYELQIDLPGYEPVREKMEFAESWGLTRVELRRK